MQRKALGAAWLTDSVERAIAAVEQSHGRLDILINNASISPSHSGRSVAVEDMDIVEWDEVLAVNLTGTFLMCRKILPLMKHGGDGAGSSIFHHRAVACDPCCQAHIVPLQKQG